MATGKREASTPVQDALAALRAAQERRAVAPLHEDGATARRKRWSGIATLLVTGLLAVAGYGLATSRSLGPSCEPITYAFEGSPPLRAVTEFRRAAQEVHDHSGVVFEESDPSRATLRVAWSDRRVTMPASSSVTSAHGARRLLAVADALWQPVHGGREFLGASITVDGTTPWSFGMERADGLGSVFTHELGHVLGLPHSLDSTSFMYHRASSRHPRWTPDDLERLADSGMLAGCRPGPSRQR